MIVPKLTAIQVRNAKPKALRYELVEAGAAGLRLIVQPSGEKSWSLKYNFDRKNRRLRLGSVDVIGEEIEGEPVIGGHLTLAAARKVAAEARRQIALGTDPSVQYRTAKEAARWKEVETKAATFLAAATNYATRHLKPKLRRWKEPAALLGLRLDENEWVVIDGLLADRWRSKPVIEITRRDVVAALDTFSGNERKRFSVLRGFFRWLLKRGELEKTPMDGLEEPRAGERSRVLSDNEVRLFWHATGKLPEPFGKLYQVLLLTAQRRSEVADMARAELVEDGLWTIPGTRTKNGRDHSVPLSLQVRQLIGKTPKTSSDYIFSTTGTTPVSGHSKMKDLIDRHMLAQAKAEAEARGDDLKKVKIEHWTFHDLRRTAATGLQKLGVTLDVTAAVLNHREGKMSTVTAIYARYGYDREKKAALEAWARRVVEIASERPKVIPWRRRRQG